MLISIIILVVLLVKANRKISDLEFENMKNEGLVDGLREEVRYLRAISNGVAKEIDTLREEKEKQSRELRNLSTMVDNYKLVLDEYRKEYGIEVDMVMTKRALITDNYRNKNK